MTCTVRWATWTTSRMVRRTCMTAPSTCLSMTTWTVAMSWPAWDHAWTLATWWTNGSCCTRCLATFKDDAVEAEMPWTNWVMVSLRSGKVDPKISTEMNAEQSGSMMYQPYQSMQIDDRITPTDPIVSASTCRYTPTMLELALGHPSPPCEWPCARSWNHMRPTTFMTSPPTDVTSKLSVMIVGGSTTRSIASIMKCTAINTSKSELTKPLSTSTRSYPNVYRSLHGHLDTMEAPRPMTSAPLSNSMWPASLRSPSELVT
ncbi:hypothetical protein H310_12351 [Aphanomyces invadans]|uniref:Uncharacterized protein n=1 Tax=Aphanomyces invadans TaxID=157072 RepID=A0A024TKB5_9STRA|nr:hypothetical protein H310_12351 [Aphanomyces invadans]ETV93787.1 hypothetical protein H310_12351 [Aphanomyces invadans]|eukprot:XP_008877596.1 hypothetical protein H310_12351 [Aphanomyces invadans]